MTLKEFRKKPLVRIFTNRYMIILLIFVIWMVFFDENSFLRHQEFNNEIKKLENEKEYFETEINQDKDYLEKLQKKEELEKFAREEYNMKKDNEEIFLIEYDTLDKK